MVRAELVCSASRGTGLQDGCRGSPSGSGWAPGERRPHLSPGLASASLEARCTAPLISVTLRSVARGVASELCLGLSQAASSLQQQEVHPGIAKTVSPCVHFIASVAEEELKTQGD